MAGHGSQRPTIVLTHDLGQRIQMLRSVGLEVPGPNDPVIVDAQQQLVDDFTQALPEGSVISLQMGEMAEEVIGEARKRWPGAFVVSAYPEIAPRSSKQIEVNRLYDLRAIKQGIGPRPGHRSLFEQTEEIAKQFQGRQVVVVDDGVYSGETAAAIINALKVAGITPVGLVAGFAVSHRDTVVKLSDIERGGTEVVLVREIPGLTTWHPDHDFFPFVPGYGRVVGFTLPEKDRTNRFPLFTFDGASYAFPYLPQFSEVPSLWEKWVELPSAAADGIGKHCLENTRKLFEAIEELSNQEVVIGNMLDTSVRTGVPLRVGKSDFPPLMKRVVSYLSELC